MTTTATTYPDQDEFDLTTSMAFGEPMGSQALNKMFHNIANHGVYEGFDVELAGGLDVEICGEQDRNTAVARHDDVSLTIHGQNAVTLTLEAGAAVAIVVNSSYEYGVSTTQVSTSATVDAAEYLQIDTDAVESHHVVLAEFDVPDGTTDLTSSMISFENRSVAGSDDMEVHLAEDDPHSQYQKSLGGGLTVGNSFTPESASYSDTTITITYEDHEISTGDTIYVSDVTDDTNAPNGCFLVTGTTGDTFSYTVDDAPTGTLEIDDATVRHGDLTVNGDIYGKSDVGDIVLRPVNNIRGRKLECDGSLLSRTTFAELFGEIGTTYGEGDGSTTFAIPDLRGEFVRGWDNGRGIDTDRELGSNQDDALQDITGTLTSGASRGQFANSGNTGAFSGQGYTSQSHGSGTSKTGYKYIDFDASLIARTADETRPRNVAMIYCIRY